MLNCKRGQGEGVKPLPLLSNHRYRGRAASGGHHQGDGPDGPPRPHPYYCWPGAKYLNLRSKNSTFSDRHSECQLLKMTPVMVMLVVTPLLVASFKIPARNLVSYLYTFLNELIDYLIL